MLSYNSKSLLQNFLPLIIQTTPTDADYQIWVVDNASTDGTWDFLEEHFPKINKLKLRINKGFTNGYVESLSQIQAKYYVLISSDIEVEGNWLLPPIEIMEKNPEFAAIQPKIKSYHQKNSFEYAGAAGGFIDFLGYPFCRGRLVNAVEEDLQQYNTAIETFWASGACMFINAELYHKSGGLDNDFYAHMEEIDLCWRLKNMGYKIGFSPDSVVYHMGGFIISYGSKQKVFRNHRNNLIMLFKNLSFWQLIWVIPFRLVLDGVTFFKMVLDGQLKAALGIIPAHWQFFLQIGKWYKKRQAAKKLWSSTPNKYGIINLSLVYQFFIKGKRKFTQLNIKTKPI